MIGAAHPLVVRLITLWETYPLVLVLAAGVVVLLASALAALFVVVRQRNAALRRLDERASELQAAKDAAEIGLFTQTLADGMVRCDARFRTLFGIDEEAPVPVDTIWAAIHPDDVGAVRAAIDDALDPDGDGCFDTEFRLADASARWLYSRGRVMFAGRAPSILTGALYEVTDRREAEETRNLLIAELNHRVKNTLTVVQSLARQTFRTSANPERAVETFRDRLHALAAAHDILAQSSWEAADLSDVARRTIPSVQADPPRVTLDGPELRLSPRMALAVAMVLNELYRNAVRHGALSVPDGNVELSWRCTGEGRRLMLELDWRERGGPPVVAPERMGFGLSLLRDILPVDAGGTAGFDFAADGLFYRLRAPLVEELSVVGTGTEGPVFRPELAMPFEQRVMRG
ncbi:Blue-light-activated histidine kinase [Jannaschia seosinensis]|uniref:histidine kinase n=1 Tax=Jannaschia seosinensis TaxID=313367 RepID=A0A0M7BDG3_9RHOB|nr:HWE histidine kinase domain-containing protein [Jannaschia seosinensis]CUH40108.1 Blue-light-activated histidine kinase [Jannaschia seosinensis]